jgi:hypothetical protein
MKQILNEWRKYLKENERISYNDLYLKLVDYIEENDLFSDIPAHKEFVEQHGWNWDEYIQAQEDWLQADEDKLGAHIDKLEEEDNLEQNIYSFDFDNTLIRYHTLEDGDVEYLGPHGENIQLVKDLAAEGNKVIIVTSRSKLKGEKRPWDKAPTPEEAIQMFDLPVEEVHYTYGNLKADKLMELGVTKHWDDDDDEIAAAWAAGIEAVAVRVEGDVTNQLRDKWKDHMQEIDKHSTNN